MWVLLKLHDSEGPIMQTDTTIGLDIAKSVFQVHGIDAAGKVLIRRQLKRRLCPLVPCSAGRYREIRRFRA